MSSMKGNWFGSRTNGISILMVLIALGAIGYAIRHRAGVRHRLHQVMERAAALSQVHAADPLPAGSFVNYHPRVLINRDLNLTELKARSRSLGRDFDDLQKFLDSPTATGFCRVSENSMLSLVMATGYMYQMTGKAAYADRLIDQFLRACVKPVEDGTDNPAFELEAGALAFDWTYDRIVARGLKAEIIDTLKKAYHATSSHADFAQYIRESDFHNYTVEFANAWLTTGLALYGEDPEAGEMIRTGWGMIAEGLPFQPTTFGDTFLYKLKASIDFSDGAMNWEGPFYWRGAAPEILRSIEAYDTASNRRQDVWKTLFAKTLNAGYYRIYGIRPDGTMPGLADGNAGMPLGWKDNFALVILEDRFKDGHIRQLIDQVKDFYGGYGTGLVFKLLFYDPKVKAEGFGDLPPSREFGREVYLRSGWTPGSSFLTFTSGSLGYYHNHLDENAFTVFRGGDLTADGGYSLKAPYYTNYFKRTVAHDAITVFDPSECWRDNTADCSLSNDGGQRWPLRRFSPPFTTEEFGINRLWSATILDKPEYREQFATAKRTVEFRPQFDYINSDATRAYTNQWSGQGSNTNRRVSLMRRELVFAKPDFVVILDRVVATQASFRKAWLLHTIKAPAVRSGGKWEDVQAGIQQIQGQDEYLVQNGPARMLVKTLLPESPKVQMIGGPGYEGWVNGRNYWTPDVDHIKGPIGRWRIEVSPSQPREADLFLHVLSIAEPGKHPEAAIERIRGTGVVGAVMHKDRNAVVVLFPEQPERIGGAQYSVSGPALHIVTGLTPGNYDVLRNGEKTATVPASEQGSVSFSSPTGGAFQLQPSH